MGLLVTDGRQQLPVEAGHLRRFLKMGYQRRQALGNMAFKGDLIDEVESLHIAVVTIDQLVQFTPFF